MHYTLLYYNTFVTKVTSRMATYTSFIPSPTKNKIPTDNCRQL